MGRHPNGGGPVFRFAHNEVIEMEACLQGLKNSTPAREMICALAEKFSASNARAGKTIVQPKQVWNWFQNRRYSQRTKVRAPENLNAPPVTQDDSVQLRNVVQSASIPQGQNAAENSQLEFEAKSARDGAWYDVSAFLSHRKIETDDPEVRVRFSGFGIEEDEWINVRMSVRQRSLPCENIECIALIPGDLILCFQEGIEQALYFDAHILDAQRRRHDIRGCRCRFLVRYDHDQSEEIVPLRKVCRRPETKFRLRQHRASGATTSSSAHDRTIFRACSSRDQNLMPRRIRKQSRLMELSTDESSAISLPAFDRHAKDSSIIAAHNATVAADENGEASQNASVLMGGDFVEVQETMEVVEI